MRAALLVVMAFSACSRAEAPPAKCFMTTEDGKTLLIEQWLEKPPSDQYGMRVTATGEVLENSTARVWIEDGAMKSERQDPAWRAAGQLSESDIAALTKEIRASFFAIPREIRTDGEVADGGTESWTACVDGRKHSVRLHGWPAVPHPGLDAFRERFREITAGAAK